MSELRSRAFVALGSNVGDRVAHLEAALAALAATERIEVVRASRFHETAPVGGPAGQPAFLNAVVALSTSLTPAELLAVLMGIEAERGRERSVEEHWGPRTLDLDLLLFDDVVSKEPDLLLPHPRMEERAFVLLPLSEVAPDLRLPASGRTAAELLCQARS